MSGPHGLEGAAERQQNATTTGPALGTGTVDHQLRLAKCRHGAALSGLPPSGLVVARLGAVL